MTLVKLAQPGIAGDLAGLLKRAADALTRTPSNSFYGATGSYLIHKDTNSWYLLTTDGRLIEVTVTAWSKADTARYLQAEIQEELRRREQPWIDLRAAFANLWHVIREQREVRWYERMVRRLLDRLCPP